MVVGPDELFAQRLRPLRRAEYEELAARGFFDDERVELLYGLLVEMSPHSARHSELTTRLAESLGEALRGRARVRSQLPLAMSDESEPEPDIAVVRLEDYSAAHPREAFLVVEVAGSSLRRDRLIKACLYAEAAIPEYWIVNLEDNVIERHRNPVAASRGYAQVTVHGRDERLPLAAFPDVEIALADILR